MNTTTGFCGVRGRWTVRLAPAASGDPVLRLLPKRLPARREYPGEARREEGDTLDCRDAIAGQLTLPGMPEAAGRLAMQSR